MSSSSFKSIFKLEIKDASIYTAVVFAFPIINILLLPFYWKVLSPSDYGIIAIIDIIGGVMGVFLGLSINQYIIIHYFEWNEKNRSSELGKAWVIHWGSAILIGLIAMPIIYWFVPYIFPEVNFFPYIFIGFLSYILASLDTVTFTTLRIKKLTKIYSFYEIIKNVLKIGLTIMLVLFLEQGLEGYFVAKLLSSFIMVFISIRIMLLFATPSFKKSTLRKMLRFSLPLVLNNFITAISSYLDRFLLQYYISVEALGVYSVGMKFAMIVNQLHKALKLSYGPFVFQYLNKSNGFETIYKLTIFYVLPLFICSTGIILFIDEFVYWVNVQSYLPIIEYMPYLVINVLLGTLVVYYGAGIIMSKRTELLLIPTSIQTITVVILSFLLIPIYGIYGIIMTKFVSVVIFLFISIFITLRVYPLKYKWSALIGFWVLTLSAIMFHQALEIEGWYNNILFSSGLMLLYLLVSISFAYFSANHQSSQILK